MKPYLLVAALVAWLGGVICAQNSRNLPLDELTRSFVERLDKRELRSGILLQQSPVMVSPLRFDGATLSEATCVDAGQFGRLYGQFRAASVSAPVLPAPVLYLDRLRGLRERADTIPLALMTMQYDYIRKDAIEKGLLLQRRDGKLEDVPGRKGSPYGLDSAFVFGAMMQHAAGKKVVFQWPLHWVFDNIGGLPDRYEVDFGDGRGMREIRPGQCITVDYQQAGKKNVVLRWRQAGRLLQGYTYIELSEVKKQPVFTGDYSAAPDEIVSLGGTSLSIFYKCSDHKLRKPLIVVEGFAGEASSWQRMIGLLVESPSNMSISLQQFLENEGYDLIWVDWANSNAAVQTNAAALQAAISWINNRKHADGSSEPNAMIGASMGGLVGKYCLLNMHNVRGLNSEVERFFTYDSPLQGANFPVGIQLFLRDALNLSSVAISDPGLDAALALIDGPAATQMLRLKAVLDNNDNLALSSAGFDALQAEIAGLEAIRPLGAITRHIALSNGAGNGVPQENVTEQHALDVLLGLSESDQSNQNELLYDVLVDFTAYTANATNTLLYKRNVTILKIGGGWEPSPNNSVSFSVPSPLALDIAPGGFTNIGLSELEQALNNALPEVEHQNGWSFSISMENFCFIPTVSALGLPITTSILTSTVGLNIPAARSSTSLDNSETSEISNMPEFNQKHVTMNPRIADVIADELQTRTPLDALGAQLVSGKVYNFGRAFTTSAGGVLSTAHSIDQNLNIQNGAQVWIDRNSRIGYTDILTNPENGHRQGFPVLVPGSECGQQYQAIVTVETGGRLLIGEYGGGVLNTGELTFREGGNLVVFGAEGLEMNDKSQLNVINGATARLKSGAGARAYNGSTVRVANGSLFTVESGATIELTDATFTVAAGGVLHFMAGSTLKLHQNNAQLIIKQGGKLILDPGVNIWLNAPESSILIEGEMVLNGNFQFYGPGYFNFGAGNLLTFGPSAAVFNLSGRGKDKRFVRLTSALNVSNFHRLNWSNGLVEVNDAVRLSNGAGLDFTNMTLHGIGAGNAIEALDAGAVNLSGCKVEWIDDAIFGDGLYGCKIDYCDFSDYLGTQIWWQNALTVGITNSTFSGSNGVSGLRFENVSIPMLKQSTFSAHGGPISGLADDTDFFGAGAAVELYDAMACLVNGCSFDNNTVAIKSMEQQQPSNIYTYGGTIFSNNKAAIFSYGDQTRGTVLSDCTIYDGNHEGIRGLDIALMIDSYNSKSFIYDTDSPNQFLRDNTGGGGAATQHHVHICYVQKGVGGSNQMRKNFWGIQNPFGFPTTDQNPEALLRLFHSNCQSIAATPSLVPKLKEPGVCTQLEELPASFSTVEPAAECTLPTGDIPGQTVAVHEQFHLGAFLMRHDSVDAGIEALRPVAALWQPVMTAMSDNCQQYIKVAKAFVDAKDAGDLQRREFKPAVQSVEKLLVAPNPADGYVVVHLPDGIWTLKIMDNLGRIRQAGSANGNYRVETSDLSPGIYFIEAVAPDGHSMTAKLVVER